MGNNIESGVLYVKHELTYENHDFFCLSVSTELDSEPHFLHQQGEFINYHSVKTRLNLYLNESQQFELMIQRFAVQQHRAYMR